MQIIKTSTLVLFIVLNQFRIISQEKEWEGPSVDFSHGKLVVSSNHRYIQFLDGTPFFYLGDTGWELFHRLNKEDTEKYLENRRKKGFTVIQAVILAELDGLDSPNAYGEKPLLNNDPLQPNEKYFEHVDWVINKAKEKGLFIGLLPTWGDKVDLQEGKGPVIFTVENAFKYGQWLGERYRNFPNIIWINGGDRTGGGKNLPVWEALGSGIKSVDKNHLMTFHPLGEHSSSEWFHNSSWLDFNTIQTGQAQRSYAIYKKLLVKDYNKEPVKPCFDGEPRYEGYPVSRKPELYGWFYDADVRQAAYWCLFSGGFGYTYGCHSIWQFLVPERKPISYAKNNWYDAVDLPGAWDMIYVRMLMESRPMLSRKPEQKLILNEYMPETDYAVATKGEGYAFIYIPTGLSIDVNLKKLDFKKVKAWWFNPRTGEVKEIGNFDAEKHKRLNPPSAGLGIDFILVLDDAEKNFDKPGEKRFISPKTDVQNKLRKKRKRRVSPPPPHT